MNETGQTQPPLIDTHAHLDSEDYEDDFGDVLERARQAGLVSIVSVGIEPSDWERTLEISRLCSFVYPVLGIHPNSADQTNTHMLADLEALCKQESPRVVGIGETGLDYYREYVPHDVQRESFRAHLDLARELDLPVVIHNRDAHADVLEILRKDGQGTRGVMHSFSGDLDFMRACLDLDYMISISGPVTFKKATDKHEVAAAAPLDMLLVETDCPYLTPEPYRGRRNEPAYVNYTARAIANIRNMAYKDLASATTENARRLFRLD
jgi:TatD DNase family protein